MTTNVTLLGGSGMLGFETFEVLWSRRGDLRLKLLLRPRPETRARFAPYQAQAEPSELEVVWGDATDYADMRAAISGADYVLDAMALISPVADYNPERSREVNTVGIANVVRAIGEEPDGNARIKLAYTGTVAMTGERQPPVHWGRVGDPLKPSLFDYYAVTKIAGERLVLESDIERWVSLRVTGIMPGEYKGFFDRPDPLAFHMPLGACLENVTSKDAAVGLANVIGIGDESDFWRGIYNLGGGPGMRARALEFLTAGYGAFGIEDIRKASERAWFATTNFHMQYFVDSGVLNDHLDFWDDTTESWIARVAGSFPPHLKLVRWLARRVPAVRRVVEKQAYESNRKLLETHRNGTLHWRNHGNTKRLDAFYGGVEAFDAVPGWDEPIPAAPDPDGEPLLLDHGYDETKSRLDLGDLRGAAEFRGGRCLAEAWDGDMFTPLAWACAFGHDFEARPNTVLKGGHWCTRCEPPDWDYKRVAARNPFLNQVVEPFAHLLPDEPVTMADLDDIRGADKDELG